MKQKLLIIGAGNIGGFISYNLNAFGQYDLLGFLDDDPSKAGAQLYGSTVLGNVASIEDYMGHEQLAVVVGIANPTVKARIAQMLERYNVIFPNFIGPQVWISEKVLLGQGIIIYPGTTINYECNIDNFVIINMNCAIGHNCDFGQYATLAPGVNLAGFTNIGKHANIGIGATTIQGIQIGDYAQVGGQTMMIKDVPPHSVIVGNPARIIRQIQN